jgi:pimeloyl-ACP methyl ester carboxylesterase
MRLRLYHHYDGARVAYRETGSGPGLLLLHSAGLTHREWEPAVDALAARFRVVLPDLPLHGDSEDRPRHPYTLDWMAEVIAGFCHEAVGPRPLAAGHDLGAELLLHAVATGQIEPARLVLMSSQLHRAPRRRMRRAAWRTATQVGALPGLDRVVSHGARVVFRPSIGDRLTVTGNPAARDLLRHAFADIGGNGNRIRAWARFVARWPDGPRHDLLDAYGNITAPVLLLWADEDQYHPLETAQEVLDLLPHGQLRVLSDCGFLMAYDDPVGVARELIAFCG